MFLVRTYLQPTGTWTGLDFKAIVGLSKLGVTVGDDGGNGESRSEPQSFDGVGRMLRRLDGLQVTMILVLEFGFAQSAALPLEGILAFVCRCLAISTDQMLQADHALLASIVPRVHLVALRILESLVGAGRGHVQVYADTISTVLRQAIRRSQPQGRLRAAVYDAIKRVMLVLGPVMPRADLDQIVVAALQDCSVQKAGGVASAAAFGGDGDIDRAAAAEQKRRGRGGVTILDEASEVRPPEVDSCMSALQMLATLLAVHAMELDAGLRQKIDHFLIAGALSCAEHDRGMQFVEERCRVELYKTLKVGISAPSPSTTSLLPQATRVFTWGLQDPSLTVRAICMESLSTCDLIVRPQFPALPRCVAPPTQANGGLPTGAGEPAGVGASGDNNIPLPWATGGGEAASTLSAVTTAPSPGVAAEPSSADASIAAAAPVAPTAIIEAAKVSAVAATKEGSNSNDSSGNNTNKRGHTNANDDTTIGAAAVAVPAVAAAEDRPAKIRRTEDTSAVATATAPVVATNAASTATTSTDADGGVNVDLNAAAAAAAVDDDDDDDMPDLVNSGPDTGDEEE